MNYVTVDLGVHQNFPQDRFYNFCSPYPPLKYSLESEIDYPWVLPTMSVYPVSRNPTLDVIETPIYVKQHVINIKVEIENNLDITLRSLTLTIITHPD